MYFGQMYFWKFKLKIPKTFSPYQYLCKVWPSPYGMEPMWRVFRHFYWNSNFCKTRLYFEFTTKKRKSEKNLCTEMFGPKVTKVGYCQLFFGFLYCGNSKKNFGHHRGSNTNKGLGTFWPILGPKAFLLQIFMKVKVLWIFIT